MRLILLKLLLPLICFNMAGGFSYVASVLANPVEVVQPNTGQEAVSQKKEASTLLASSQIFKEADDIQILKDLLGTNLQEPSQYSYRFSVDKGFSLQYYLSYYDHHIKVHQPQAHLLGCVFII